MGLTSPASGPVWKSMARLLLMVICDVRNWKSCCGFSSDTLGVFILRSEK